MPHTFVLGCFHLTPTILYVFTPFGDIPALEIFFICRFVFQPFGEAPATPFASSFSSVCRYAIFSARCYHLPLLCSVSTKRPTNQPSNQDPPGYVAMHLCHRLPIHLCHRLPMHQCLRLPIYETPKHVPADLYRICTIFCATMITNLNKICSQFVLFLSDCV